MDNKNFVASEGVASEAPPTGEHAHPGPPPDYFAEDLPPAYQVASALPTYEEAELTKGKKYYF